MNAIEIILLNFKEIRRRSIKLWKGIPEEHFLWKPDAQALSIIEMIRHVLETEHLYHKIILNRGNLGDYQSPWNNLEYTNLDDELAFAAPYRKSFIHMIENFSLSDLENIIIDRTEVNQRKKLGDYLNRTAYHEAIHTGQMLGYLRSLQVERPIIWD